MNKQRRFCGRPLEAVAVLAIEKQKIKDKKEKIMERMVRKVPGKSCVALMLALVLSFLAKPAAAG